GAVLKFRAIDAGEIARGQIEIVDQRPEQRRPDGFRAALGEAVRREIVARRAHGANAATRDVALRKKEWIAAEPNPRDGQREREPCSTRQQLLEPHGCRDVGGALAEEGGLL